MAKQLQLIYDEILEQKMEVRDIKELYKSAVEQMEEHAFNLVKIKKLRDHNRQLEQKAKESLGKSWEKLEDIQNQIKVEKETMTDVALRDLMDGKTVLVKDRFENEYEPVWSVKFIKVNGKTV